MIPAVMTEVVRLLKHDRELVRKKAVMVLHRMNQLDPSVSSPPASGTPPRDRGCLGEMGLGCTPAAPMVSCLPSGHG